MVWGPCRLRRVTTLALLPAAAALLWFGSPYLRERVEHVAIEYKEYQETNRPTSTGQRLTYWKDSFSWIREAPIVGHGTGSVNELFERTAESIDDIAVIRGMHGDSPNHEPSLLLMNCGEARLIRPSLGSWLLYGLGSENQDLPGFVVISPAQPAQGAPLWGSSFLPAALQGTLVQDLKRPIAHLAELRAGSPEHPPLSAASAARAVSAVRGLHRFAAREGIVALDVSREVKPPAPPKRLPKALDVEQVTRLLAVPGSVRDVALLEVLYGTGARISEGVRQSFWLQGMMAGFPASYLCIKAFSETDFTSDLKKFDVPTLVLHGDDDQIVPIGASALLSSKLIKNAVLKIYKGAPHGLCTTLKDAVNEELFGFLRG